MLPAPSEVRYYHWEEKWYFIEWQRYDITNTSPAKHIQSSIF
jgi:hypothetical protein